MVAETCRRAFAFQILMHLVGNKLVYKRKYFCQTLAAIQLVTDKHCGNNLREGPYGSRKK